MVDERLGSPRYVEDREFGGIVRVVVDGIESVLNTAIDGQNVRPIMAIFPDSSDYVGHARMQCDQVVKEACWLKCGISSLAGHTCPCEFFDIIIQERD